MDIIAFSEELQGRMKEQMKAVTEAEQSELALTAQFIAIVKDTIYDLEQVLYNYSFKNQTEEIRFFKEIKPVFVSQYIYQSKVFSLRLFDSFNGTEDRKRYYNDLMGQLEKFASKNRDFYVYIMSNAIYADGQYFTRISRPILRGNPFATPMDYKLSRLLANEMLKKYLSEAMEEQQIQGVETNLKWTASKTALIELGVALQTAGVFNNSNAGSKEIFSAFERLFKVDLKDHYRIFLQIKERKKGQTAFLDQLKERLLKKIDEADEL